MAGYRELKEEKLLQCLANGDELAFTELFNRYWSRMIALAYSHTKDKHQAEEIVQEVFMALWKRRDAVIIKSLSAYLATAVKFSIFKHIGRNSRKAKFIDDVSNIIHLPSYDLPDELVHAKLLEDYTNQIIEELPEKCRLIYLCSRKEQLSISEIASRYQLSNKTVEAHLTKALKTIRFHLKDVMTLILIVHLHR